MRSSRLAALAALALPLLAPIGARAQGPNPTNLWLVDLHWVGERLTVGTPVKLTHDDGSNSQPSFSPDGKAVVFSATRDTGADARSDIYRIELTTRVERRVTHTPENENSPTVNARGEYSAIRWQPATLFREFGPWRYAPDGTPTTGILRGGDTTGYYTPLDRGAYALTRPKSRTFTIALFDPTSGAITDVDSGVPALPAQRIPGERALSYVRIDSATAHHVIRRYDLSTHTATDLVPTLVDRTAHAWVPGHRTILMAKGSSLYARRIGHDTAWRLVATFANPELRNANAYVVSPRGDRLILTSPKRLPLAVAMRDSLETGHSVAEVVAMVRAWRDARSLASLDVTEGAIGGLTATALQRGQFADAVTLQTLATELFPSSAGAFARLGDARRAAGDSASAIDAYKRSLELNPRTTDAERAAAAAVARKLGTSPR